MSGTANDPGLPSAEDKGWGMRHVQVALLFSAVAIGTAHRSNMSMAIVAMTNKDTSSNPDIPTFELENYQIILGCFFYTYAVLQIPTGFLSNLYGAKYILLGTFFVNTLVNMLIPFVAIRWPRYGLTSMRATQGLAQGCMLPCVQTLFGKWLPTEERSTLGGIVYTAFNVGSSLAFICAGSICASSLGWPFTFYFWGALGMVWCIIYMFIGASSPAQDRHIKPRERHYIERSLNQTASVLDRKIPLRSILTCIHFWAVVAGNIGNGWISVFLQTQMPTYLGNVVKFQIRSNGLVSAAPYMASAITGFILSPVADCLIRRNYLSRVNTRRIMQITGGYGTSIFLLMLVNVAYSDKTAAVIIIIIANIFYAATLLGYPLGNADLSPRFAGVMFGISNTIGFCCGLVATLMVHYVVLDLTDICQWRIVFILTAVLFSFVSTIYGLFISADRQPWDATASMIALREARALNEASAANEAAKKP